jgi:hypothetical protein
MPIIKKQKANHYTTKNEKEKPPKNIGYEWGV